MSSHTLSLIAAVQLSVDTPPPPPARAATATIVSDDADRFAALFARTGGKPDAARIQKEYLDRGSYGLSVVMAPRIGSAARMASAIAAKPGIYAQAIEICLPVARAATADLRAIFARYEALFPDKRLPQVYLTFGSDTTGGTADGAALVIGMETFCASAMSAGALRDTIRAFIAHETVHALQEGLDRAVYDRSPLLATVLMEGAADALALEVTGVQPDVARDRWARHRRTALLMQFRADVETTAGWPVAAAGRNDPRWTVMRRWVWNYGRAPEGWPVEAGYWVGQQLWADWLAKQSDRPAALRELITIRDADAILAAASS